MSVRVEAFLALEDGLTARLSNIWRRLAAQYRLQLTAMLAKQNYAGAADIANSLDLSPIIEENKEYIRYVSYSALLFGASRLNDDVKSSVVAAGGFDDIITAQTKQLEKIILTNAEDFLRDQLLVLVAEAQNDDPTAPGAASDTKPFLVIKFAYEELVEKFNPNHNEIGQFATGAVDRPALIARGKELKATIKVIMERATVEGGLTRLDGLMYEKLMGEMFGIQFDLMKPLTVEKVPSAELRRSTLSPETVVAAHTDLMRNRAAYDAIQQAAFGTFFNADTPVDTVMNGGNPKITAEEFRKTFDATRAALRAQYGDTIPLYRSPGKQKTKATQNWATTKEFAGEFGPKVIQKNISVDDVIAVNVGTKGLYHELIIDSKAVKGSALSGNRGHAGRPGFVGGSGPGGDVHPVIKDFEKRFKAYNPRMEWAQGIDADGNKIWQDRDGKMGNENSVSFTGDELRKFNDGVLTHNHPGGNSFSVDDIELASRTNMKEVRAVGDNIFVMTRGAEGWPTADEVFNNANIITSELRTEYPTWDSWVTSKSQDESGKMFQHELMTRLSKMFSGRMNYVRA